MADRTAAIADLVTAAHTMAALGLVTAFGHVSARHDDHMLITPAIDLRLATTDTILQIPLGTATLPPEMPGEAWVHLAVYQARPDVTAIARAQPEAALAIGAVTSRIPPVHGQGAMLGEAVPVHDDARLMRSLDLARTAARTLGQADALVLRGNGAVTTGTTPGHAVARMWLLDTSCRLYLAARQAGTSKALTADEIAAWRAAAPPLLDRLWTYLQRATVESSADAA
ncbi:class II aldolase/adducin family protein [Actinoallomurus sp. CA-150999]|uniref:class II aldolase/adducin family protein n=1 Tax=Actinoallomurus sp. CA-150999 TaxID=3239887 RepID=UPI003D8DE761